MQDSFQCWHIWEFCTFVECNNTVQLFSLPQICSVNCVLFLFLKQALLLEPYFFQSYLKKIGICVIICFEDVCLNLLWFYINFLFYSLKSVFLGILAVVPKHFINAHQTSLLWSHLIYIVFEILRIVNSVFYKIMGGSPISRVLYQLCVCVCMRV